MQEYQILPILILKIIPINKYTFKIIHTSLKIKSQKSIKKKKKKRKKIIRSKLFKKYLPNEYPIPFPQTT